jgi:YbgC/YbaW family acyl-CoA thioester hydrolase
MAILLPNSTEVFQTTAVSSVIGFFQPALSSSLRSLVNPCGLDVPMETPALDTEVRVMFFDTDAGGLVHNIAYLRFIETNRSLLAEKMGYPLVEMLDHGDCPVVVRTEIDYRRPARLWDTLLVHGELEKFERSRFWCGFTITRPNDGQLLVTCRQMLVVVRLPKLKVQRLPTHWETDFSHLKGN